MFGLGIGEVVLKYVLPILAVAGILFGVYEYGHSKGYDAGHQIAWDTQQKTINGMVDKENAQAEANNKAIASVEADSFKYATDNKNLQAQLDTKRTTVVTQYVQANPQSASSCGLDVPLVQAINQLIQADPAIAGSATPGASK